MDITFREDSSLLEILKDGLENVDDRRAILDALVFQIMSEKFSTDKKLFAIYRMAEMILKYEDFCEGGPDGIL